jgi:nucleoside recognition membrane protein YjiH
MALPAQPNQQARSRIQPWTTSDRQVKRIWVWVVFLLMVAFAPFVIQSISLWLRNLTVSIEALFGKGELFIVSLAIAADGAGEIFYLRHRTHWTHTVILIFCGLGFVMSILATGVYGSIVFSPTNLDPMVTARFSIWFCYVTILISGICKLGSEG